MDAFEKWWGKNWALGGKDIAEEAFRAGMLAAAEIAEKLYDRHESTWKHTQALGMIAVAEAIRKAADQ